MGDDGNKGRNIKPIQGMESVIATVSGYHGTERFKLIKLISQTGANYVGSMDRCTTHLVCWKFHGKKFDLARSLGKYIISHRWFEDCLKQNKRLLENPYTMQSGQEAGPISWEMPAVFAARGKDRGLLEKNSNMPLDLSYASDSKGYDVSTSCNDIPCFNRSDSLLSNEPVDSNSLEPMCLSNNRRNTFDGSNIIKISEGPSKSHRLRKKRTSDYVEKSSSLIVPSVQKLISETTCNISNNSKSMAVIPNEEITKQNNFVHTEEKTKYFDVQIEQKTRASENSEASCQDSNTRLACVICYTDFSLTRGILPCGHRFCYSCIQGWAGYVASRGKIATCPICKANFSHITKFEASASDDQKIFSQTVPSKASMTNIYMPSSSNRLDHHDTWLDTVCCECHNQDPEDLLTCCQICRNRWVHSFCLDPPLIPWTCVRCSDLRLLYQRFL